MNTLIAIILFTNAIINISTIIPQLGNIEGGVARFFTFIISIIFTGALIYGGVLLLIK